MDGLDLKAFLESQSSQGVVDSHGSFTVAREKALQKLAHFALPGEYDWVLKIVQAANVWDAPRLVVRQTRVATSFFFCPPRGVVFPGESAIIEALGNPVLDKDDPIHQLAMALRSLVEQSRLSFVLAIRQHGELCKPIFAGDDVSGLSSKTREEWTLLKQEGVRLTVSHFTGGESITGRYVPTFSRQARRDVEILRIIERRCYASSVPIDVDTRPIARIFPRGDFFESHRHRPLFLGRLRKGDYHESFRASQFQLLSIHLPRNYLTVSASREDREHPWFFATGPEWKTLNAGYQALSRMLSPIDREPAPLVHTLAWVRQGVIVDGFRFSPTGANQLSLSVFFPADGLRTDLSGLKIELDRKAPSAALSAMLAIRLEISNLLRQGGLKEALLAQPQTAPSTSPAAPAPEEGLEGSGESAFSQSLVQSPPTFGLGMLVLMDSAAELLAHLPQHDQVLERWAKLIENQLDLLLADLGAAPERLVRVEV